MCVCVCVFVCACVFVFVCVFIPRENSNGSNYDALALMELNRVKEGWRRCGRPLNNFAPEYKHTHTANSQSLTCTIQQMWLCIMIYRWTHIQTWFSLAKKTDHWHMYWPVVVRPNRLSATRAAITHSHTSDYSLLLVSSYQPPHFATFSLLIHYLL